MKTKVEIKQEIEKLKTMKPNVRQYSAFGDDNHAAIEAQIIVLEEGLDEDDIYANLFDEEDAKNGREEIIDDGVWSQYAVDSALDALDWVNDENENAPSEDWKDLVSDATVN